MLTEYNIKRYYDSKHADSVYAKLKGHNQELKVDLFKRAARKILCLLLFGPLLKKFTHPWCRRLKNEPRNPYNFYSKMECEAESTTFSTSRKSRNVVFWHLNCPTFYCKELLH